MFCSKCGAKMPDDGKFCAACGARLEGAAEVSAVTEPVVIKPNIPHPPKKARKTIVIHKKKLVKVLAPVMALVLVASVLMAFFGKRTIYVQTAAKTKNSGQKNSITMEYDKNGVLLSRNYENGTSQAEYTYQYDDNGRVEGVTVEQSASGAPYTWELEYHYDGDGVLEEITGSTKSGVRTMVATCDEGAVTKIEIFGGGELSQYRTYNYHDNGMLAQQEVENYGTDGEVYASSIYEYSESGKMLRSEQKYTNGEVIMEMGYDRQDRLVEWTYITDYDNGAYTAITVTWRNNWRGRITDPVMEMEVRQNGELQSVTVTGAVEWDGNKATITAGEIDDDNAEDFSEDDFEDVEIKLEYGDHGYITEMECEFDGVTVFSQSWEYTAVKVSRNYKNITAADPYWCMLWG